MTRAPKLLLAAAIVAAGLFPALAPTVKPWPVTRSLELPGTIGCYLREICTRECDAFYRRP